MVSIKLDRGSINELWQVVEKIVLQEYPTIKDMTMRNSFYHVREILSRQKITLEQLNYFLDKYDYYQSDKWSCWEKKHKITRPISKDPTIAIYNSRLQALAYVTETDFFFDRCQGFLFIEKSGFINDLKLLSSYGWVVLAGQGFCSREVREQIAKNYSDKPILVLHDFDYAGGQMFDVFEKGSKRTKHLNLTFENVIDIGLCQKDVEELDLPLEPESVKYRDKQKWRVELNALTVLINRRKIQNPLLWFVVKKMKEKNIPLHKEEQSSIEALKFLIGFEIELVIGEIIKPIVSGVLEKIKDETILDVDIQNSVDGFFSEELIKELQNLSEEILEEAEYIDIKETEQAILYSSKVIEKITPITRRKPVLKESEES